MGYLVREQDGSLFWFENKPVKSRVNGIWKIDLDNTNEPNHFVCLSNIFPQCKFDFIKWEDEEPYKIIKMML